MKLPVELSDDPALSALWRVLLEHASGDAAHDPAHCLRVGRWTVRLAEGVPGRWAWAAALLHDVVFVAKDSPERSQASQRSADQARELLQRFSWEPGAVDTIVDAIRCHSFSRGELPQTPLGRALRDADRLEALGALGMARCFATGAQMGSSLFDADDPWAESRALNDRRYCLDHFFVKLLRLREGMLTPQGRLEAERRLGVMRAFCEALGEELEQPLTGERKAAFDRPAR